MAYTTTIELALNRPIINNVLHALRMTAVLHRSARVAQRIHSDYIGDMAYAAKYGTTPKDKLHMLYKLRLQTGKAVSDVLHCETVDMAQAIEKCFR